MYWVRSRETFVQQPLVLRTFCFYGRLWGADFRTLVNGKKDKSQFENYKQVFDNKHGFLNNLSILDLLFHEGKYALDYLKSQK